MLDTTTPGKFPADALVDRLGLPQAAHPKWLAALLAQGRSVEEFLIGSEGR